MCSRLERPAALGSSTGDECLDAMAATAAAWPAVRAGESEGRQLHGDSLGGECNHEAPGCTAWREALCHAG